MVVFKNTDTEETTCICSDEDALIKFYQDHKAELFAGFNIRHYDQYIFKGIINGFDPYEINDWIITQRKRGYEFSGAINKTRLNQYDVMPNKFKGLKQYEGAMGHDIRETTVPFDLDRELTEEEIKEVEYYCNWDVNETIEVFLELIEEFESHLGLIKEYRLPLYDISRTKTQLAAKILGAKKPYKPRNDEWDIKIPDTLKLNKYKYVKDWYMNSENHNYDLSLETTVCEVPTTFAWGGVHGAPSNLIIDGIIIVIDVASLYPSLMIEYDYLSRNVENKAVFRTIRDERLKLKAAKDKRQQPRKIVLNSTYGGMKDKYSQLFDPQNANNVCIGGQLLLLDLCEKLEPHCDLLNLNTDGVFLRVDSEKDVAKIRTITEEWEKRTRLDLEWEFYTNLVQKDVNNFIMWNHNDGKIKRKGAYVKKLNNLDYNFAVVNNAVVDYFVKGIEPEKTISNCKKLRDFQYIYKIGTPYAYGKHGDSTLNERVIRIFASKNEDDPGVYKIKIQKEDAINSKGEVTIPMGSHRPAKIENSPEHCRIINEDVTEMEIPEWLDLDWYCSLAKERINAFIESD